MKSYTVTVGADPITAKTFMHRKNDGFTALELLGICAMISAELLEQMAGRIRPDIIKREVVISCGAKKHKKGATK